MAYNDIQYLKGSDTVNSSVDIINKNFKSLKDAISAGNISLAKYDQDIQEMIEKLKNDFSNVTDAIYNTLDITKENWTKEYKQLEAKTESATGELAAATLTLQSYSNEDVTGAIAELEAKVSGIDTDTILSQLSLLAEKTADTETAMATLYTLIGGSDYDTAEIAAGIESLSQRMGEIETAYAGIKTKINNAESSITSLTTKTSDLLTTQNEMLSEIDGVSASLGTCVKKDADGKIESSAYIAADKIDLTGSVINFNTGTGIFKGDVKACSFAVVNNKNKETIKFKTWTSEDKSAYTSVSIEEGTPVLIATTYASDGVTVSKQYVTSMMELVSSGTSVTESCTSAIYLASDTNFKASVLCNSSSNSFNNNVYKVGDTYRTGTSASYSEADGRYLERDSVEMIMSVQIGSYEYLINVPYCYMFTEYIYNGGNLSEGGNTYYCVPSYSLSNSGDTYTLTFNTTASGYRFVSTIAETSDNADIIQAAMINGYPYTISQFNGFKQSQNSKVGYVSEVESSSDITSGHTALEYEKYVD